jgi:hypothetical protein
LVDPDVGAPLLEPLLARYPYLAAFAASPACAIVRVKIGPYQLVSHFQRDVAWRIPA